jgi:Tfp pilus assembly protein PilV
VRGEAGFSLMEAIVATVIATVAVVGLAYTFGQGRALINRFEMARAALGVAQQRLELLHVEPRTSDAFSTDSLHVRPFVHAGRQAGFEEWAVSWYDDPSTPTANDLKKVTVIVRWTQGSLSDSVSLSRLFLPN